MLVSLLLAVGALGTSPGPRRAAVLYASHESAASVAAAARLIRGTAPGYAVEAVRRIDRTTVQDADLVVVLCGGGLLARPEDFDAEALQRKKVVGIGIGAAYLFDDLNLSIGRGDVDYRGEGMLEFTATGDPSLPASARPETGGVFDPPFPEAVRKPSSFVFGVPLAALHERSDGRDAHAYALAKRSPGDEAGPGTELALVATATNPFLRTSAVLVGVEGRVDRWSGPFRRLVRASIEAYAQDDPSPRP